MINSIQIGRLRETLGGFNMRLLTISLPDYLYEKLTRQAKSFKTSLEELVLFQLKGTKHEMLRQRS